MIDMDEELRKDVMQGFIKKLKHFDMKPWDFIELWNYWMQLTPNERGRILETKED